MGILALSSGESELAAVDRAATAGKGLQLILSDFGFFGHVAINSDATAAIGIHRLGSGKVPNLAVGDLWVQLHVRSEEFESPKCQDWRIRVMHKRSTLGQNHCFASQKRVIWHLWMDEPRISQSCDRLWKFQTRRRRFLQMVKECEKEPNGTQPWEGVFLLPKKSSTYARLASTAGAHTVQTDV